MMEAERELRAAEEDVERLQRELSAPRDAHEDMARQELQRLLDEHLVLYNAPSDRMRCLARATSANSRPRSTSSSSEARSRWSRSATTAPAASRRGTSTT